jgi:hypothetical protein
MVTPSATQSIIDLPHHTMPLESTSTRDASANVVKNLLLAIATLWCIYWFVHAWHYWEDDAYIHLEFARSLAAGQGFAFNGHVVAGDTSPFWVFLLAGMHALIPNWLVAGKVLTILGAAFGLSGIYAFARRLTSSWAAFPNATIFPSAIVLLVVVNPYSCYWIFSGMEPIAAAGLACFAVLAATQDVPTSSTFYTGCILAGIAPLLRPEMIFLTALVALPLIGQFRRLARPTAIRFVAGLILIAGPVALWSIYSLHAFGHVLPNTNAAKRANPEDSVVRHLLSIYSLGLPLIVGGLVAGIIYVLSRPSATLRSLRNALTLTFAPSASARQPSRSLPLAGWIFILWPAFSAIFYVANHTYVQTRYILVTAPGLTVVILVVAFAASRRAGRVIYLTTLLAAAVVSLAIVRPFITNKGIDCDQTTDMALFIRNQLPPDAPVAMYAIGQIAFISQHPIIDTGGITRPDALRYLTASPVSQAHWAQTQGAKYYIGMKPQPDAVAAFTIHLKFIGWTLNTSRYNEAYPVAIWKLAPTPSTPPQTEPPPPRPVLDNKHPPFN